LHFIQRFKDSIPDFDTQLVDRMVWAGMNANVLAEANVQIHKASVRLVSPCELPRALGNESEKGVFGYKIELDNGEAV